MQYIIRDVIFILLAIVGIADIAKIILLWLLKSDGDKNVVVVVPLTAQTDNAEQLLRCTMARTEYCGKGRWKKIVCVVDDSVNDESKEICRRLSHDYPIITVKDSQKDILT